MDKKNVIGEEMTLKKKNPINRYGKKYKILFLNLEPIWLVLTGIGPDIKIIGFAPKIISLMRSCLFKILYARKAP